MRCGPTKPVAPVTSAFIRARPCRCLRGRRLVRRAAPSIARRYASTWASIERSQVNVAARARTGGAQPAPRPRGRRGRVASAAASAAGVGGRDEQRGVADDLLERRAGGRDERRAARERLERGQPKPSSNDGYAIDLGPAEQRRERRRRRRSRGAGCASRRRSPRSRRAASPTPQPSPPASDELQVGVRGAMRGERAHERRHVLAGLDRARRTRCTGGAMPCAREPGAGRSGRRRVGAKRAWSTPWWTTTISPPQARSAAADPRPCRRCR